MACDLRIASDRAQFGTFEVRRGMHPADGGIPRLINACGVGFAMELLLTGEPVSAERAYHANMINRVVPHADLEAETDRLVQTILRCDQAAIESAKQTVHEVIGRTLHDQLRVEAMWGYALCAANPTVMGRSQDFFDKTDRGRAGGHGNPALKDRSASPHAHRVGSWVGPSSVAWVARRRRCALPRSGRVASPLCTTGTCPRSSR